MIKKIIGYFDSLEGNVNIIIIGLGAVIICLLIILILILAEKNPRKNKEVPHLVLDYKKALQIQSPVMQTGYSQVYVPQARSGSETVELIMDTAPDRTELLIDPEDI